MESVIGVFDSYEKAVLAIQQLQEACYPVTKLTIVGQGEVLYSKSKINILLEKEVAIGGIVGSILGILIGAGVWVIPGVNVPDKWSACIGGIVGFWSGMGIGGLTAIITAVGIGMKGLDRYEEYLEEGKFVMMLRGNQDEIFWARDILLSKSEYMELNEYC